MKKYTLIIVLIVIVFTQLFCNLPIEVPNDYPTIQEAIDHAHTLSGYVTIEVSQGIYYETLDIDFTSGLLSLTLIGVDGAENCIIDGGNGQNIVDVENYYQLEKSFKISGFTIRNSITASGIYAHTSNNLSLYLNIEISDNVIQNCKNGIDLFQISDCLVKNNSLTNYSDILHSRGIHSGCVNNVIIDGNFISNFQDNLSFFDTYGKATNNKIEVGVYSSLGIRLHNESNVDIINNLLLIDSGIKTGIHNGGTCNATIINNTILGFGGFTNGYMSIYSGTTEKFVNNIMWNLETNILAGSNAFEVNYCCYNGTIPTVCEPIENHNVININPDLTPDYHLSEDSILLIDHADPDTNGNGVDWQYDEDDRDIDGSRKDMGCYPYLHDYDTKVFTKGVHWVSFPVLTTLDDPYLSPPNPSIPPINGQLYQQAYWNSIELSSGLLQESAISTGTIDGFIEILGNRYGTPMEIVPQGVEFELYDTDFKNMLFRHEGYKIEIGNVTTPTELIVGAEEGDERLPVNYEISGSMVTNEYHWIGYWIPRTQNIVDAFGELWQSVVKVKSEDWFYSPAIIQRGEDPNPNYPIALSAENLTLEYGKAYLVLFDAQIEDFQWTDSSITVEAEKKSEPESFTYTEKADYEAIDVFNIPPNVSEIGVFEDDICVGAVVVEDTCAQILVYSDNANRNPIPFTFEVVTGRGFSSPINNYQVMDMETGKYETKSIFSSRQEYSVMRFSEEEELEDNILLIPQLHGNYPNPFNPTTTISFSLPEEQEIDLTIYNIKGQKVKRLIDGQLTSGQHSLTWDGKDTNGKSVSTGIYFYRLKTGKKELSRKMLLLK